MLEDISLSEYIPLTEVFDDNENQIGQDQAKVFTTVQGIVTGLGGKGWGCGSSHNLALPSDTTKQAAVKSCLQNDEAKDGLYQAFLAASSTALLKRSVERRS